MVLDGTASFVNVSSSSSLVIYGEQVAVEMWMKPSINLDNSTSKMYLVMKGNEYTFFINDGVSDGKMRFAISIDTIPGPGGMHSEVIGTTTDHWMANTWYHLAGTYDGNSLRIYVDGVLENSRAVSGELWTQEPEYAEYPLSIGAYTWMEATPPGMIQGYLYFFNGTIDEVKIYDYARTAEEIWSDYSSLIVSLPWKDHFNYGTKDGMKAAGWTLNREEWITLSPSVIRFDNDGSQGSGAYFIGHFPSGVSEYAVEAKSRWVGRDYAQRYFNVWTQRHVYMWYGDGYYPNYCFMRDDVEVLRFSGYAPTFNEWSVFKLEKKGNTFYMYENNQLKNTYVEPDATLDELIGVNTGAGWVSTMEYDYISVKSTSVHDIAVLDVTTTKTTCLPIPAVGKNCAANVTVTFENRGNYTETFNVTISAGTISIQNLTVNLSNGTKTSVTFTWNTTDFGYGNCTLVVEAIPVEGEIDTEDNTHSLCWIIITIPGDVDGNGLVDIYDVVRVTSIYEARIGDPQYSSNSDINGDGIIDIFDVVACTSHYDESW